MKSRTKKLAIITAGALLAAILLIAVSYLLYVVCSYHRVEDELSLAITGDGAGAVPTGEALSLITYNVGFGAYGPDYSFFMDGGEHSRALSEEDVIQNIGGALDLVRKEAPSFVLLQEVDTNGTRSYHVDESAVFSEGLAGYDRIFAENYDSPYFFYPFHEPIGANQSGMMTFSRFDILSAKRRSLPIEDSLYKYLDLDRAYSVSVLETSNGRELILYNVHLSAYTSDGKIADEQLKMLCEDMQNQYEKGNYVIAAGDFNKDLLGDSSEYFERAEGEFTWAKPFDIALLPEMIEIYSGTNAPTCRNADSPFRGDGTDFVLSVDGILISDNIELLSCKTVDTDFLYSDHDPVKVEFRLIEN